MPTIKTNDIMEISLQDDTQAVLHLLTLSQTLMHVHDRGKQLCQEVAKITQGRARLLLSSERSSNEPPFPSSTSISFPIRFYHRSYGRMYLVSNSGGAPLALPVAHLLAQLCGLLLYTLELSTLMEGQCKRLALDGQLYGHLTKREQEILALFCHGYDLQAIASHLQITAATVETHKKHLCQKFGAHCERDLPLAAYQARLFFLLNASEESPKADTHARREWSSLEVLQKSRGV